MERKPKIFLHYSLDNKTLEILPLLKEEVKVYHTYKNYFLLYELISEEFTDEKFIRFYSLYTPYIGLTFHDDDDQKEVVPVYSEKGQLEIQISSETYFVNGNQNNYAQLYEKREFIKNKIILIDFDNFQRGQLRNLMYLSFVMEWNRCEGIVFKNYRALSTDVAIDTLGLLIKGVLSNFAEQTFIFHPFRSRS